MGADSREDPGEESGGDREILAYEIRRRIRREEEATSEAEDEEGKIILAPPNPYDQMSWVCFFLLPCGMNECLWLFELFVLGLPLSLRVSSLVLVFVI